MTNDFFANQFDYLLFKFIEFVFELCFVDGQNRISIYEYWICLNCIYFWPELWHRHSIYFP